VTRFDVHILRSADEVRANARQWNQLWQGATVTHPTARAEPLAIWLETFSAGQEFLGIVVTAEDRFAAALPLVKRRTWSAIKAATLPANVWAGCGDLMIGDQHDPDPLIDLLIDAVLQSGCSLLWLEGLDIGRPDWIAFQRRLRQRGLQPSFEAMFPIGIVDIPHDWDRYFASRSRNHRRQIRRGAERLRDAGGGTLRIYSTLEQKRVEPLLRLGFELEERGWKARHGDCVLRHPDVFEFFRRQAEALAETGHLELVFLECAGQPIAFEYGYRGKGIYFSPKVAYDEAFAEISPGQQLRALLYQQFQRDPDLLAVDFHGPLAEATAKWATRAYTLGRLLCPLGGAVGRVAVAGYRALRRTYKAVRKRLKEASAPDLQVRPLGDAPRSDAAAEREHAAVDAG
jgi:CelD/BcsL family acetyltransferase involved in cellulose biosynthesis